MKIKVTFGCDDAAYDGKLYHTAVYSSIKEAAKSCGRSPRILSYKLNHGGPNIVTPFGIIISIEAIDGKTDDVGSEVREHTDSAEENLTVGTVEVRTGWGRIKQALGEAAAAVKRYVSQFYKP
jgi:hypothetical protein